LEKAVKIGTTDGWCAEREGIGGGCSRYIDDCNPVDRLSTLSICNAPLQRRRQRIVASDRKPAGRSQRA
jgi:hypothetical protein